MTVEEWIKDEVMEAREEFRAEGRAEGLAEGRTEGKAGLILELLEDIGSVPENLKEDIRTQRASEVLKRWARLAARVTSIEEFQKEM